MRQLLWRSETVDRLLYLMAAFVVVVSLTQSALYGQDEFSIHKAQPMAQEPPVDAREMKFSIHQMEAPVSEDEILIGFSVHNAKPFPKPPGDVGDAKPCSEARQVNRVLVFLDTSKRVEQRNVQFCQKGKPCQWILQNVDVVLSPASQSLSKELAKLDKGWEAAEDGCVHFKLVEFSDPRNADMVKELKVQAQDLPLLMKESEPDRRKKASGMTAKQLMEWWNQQFLEPGTERVKTVQGTGLPYHVGHNCPKCGRMQYDIQNDNGPVANSHIHRCNYCGTSWYHGDGGRALATPGKVGPVQAIKPQASRAKPVQAVALGYSRGTPQGEIAQYALAVAQQTARAPPPRMSFSSDPKKAAKEEKKWKEDERKRIRKEVRRKVWSKYATFDPFTWITIIQIIIQVLNFIFNQYGLN